MRDAIALALIDIINAELVRQHSIVSCDAFSECERNLAWQQMDKLNSALAQSITTLRTVWIDAGEPK